MADMKGAEGSAMGGDHARGLSDGGNNTAQVLTAHEEGCDQTSINLASADVSALLLNHE
jgi:hypothetical protein